MSAPDPDRPFDEPWQAQAFALAVSLSQAGVFTWPQWATAFGARLATGTDYWPAWLQTLESLLAERGIAAADDLAHLAHRWQDAARATPHGQPIVLENAPIRSTQ